MSTRNGKVPTASDVARAAGVSGATVSYVLSGRRSGKSRISERTRNRVLEAARLLNYVPNQSARALSLRMTERICVVVPQLGAPYNDHLVGGIRERVARHGYSTIVAVDDARGHPELLMDQLRRRVADGVVLLIEDYVEADSITSLAQQNIAVVVVGEFPAVAGVDVIHTDITEACRQAIAHLHERGHERIAFVGKDLPSEKHSLRLEGFIKAMKARDLAVDQELILAGSRSREAAYQSATKILGHAHPPTAVFAASDIAAVSTIWAARDMGFRIPEELAVIGIGNITEASVIRPSLTSVGPRAVASDQIADFLLTRLSGDATRAGRTYHQAWEIAVREST